MILKFYPDVKYSNFCVNMLTALKKFGQKVRLFAFGMGTGSIYEPELFPAAIYRFKDNLKHVALVFANGCVTMVGPKTKAEMNSRFEHLETVLKVFFMKPL